MTAQHSVRRTIVLVLPQILKHVKSLNIAIRGRHELYGQPYDSHAASHCKFHSTIKCEVMLIFGSSHAACKLKAERCALASYVI